MKQETWHIIGVMSGTSLDGLDIVYVQFEKATNYSFKIIASETIAYTSEIKKALQHVISFSEEKIRQLDIDFGKLIAIEIHNFKIKNKIDIIDFIASHGHTVFHDPDNGITLQIGNGAVIAKETNTKIICDFRSQDVAFGGQGAPLVPIGDALLFSEYSYCLNIGGFCNISSEENGKRIAFDVCPANIVLNYYANKLGLPYDDEGEIASKGKINNALLSTLNTLDYYKMRPPKSLGLEWVQKNIFPLLENSKENIETILRTFIEHIATQITVVTKGDSSILVTGGGAFNTFLMQRIKALSKMHIVLPKKDIIEYKEALIFAFLGLLRSENQVNCLKSVTGAIKDHSSGVIFCP